MLITPITFNTIDKSFLPTGSPFMTLSSKENVDHARYVRRYYGLRKGHGQYAVSSEPLTYVQVQHLLAYEFTHSTPVLDLYNADVDLSVCYANYLASTSVAVAEEVVEETEAPVAEVVEATIEEAIIAEEVIEVPAEETKPEEVLVEAPPVKKAPAKRRPAKKKVVDQA